MHLSVKNSWIRSAWYDNIFILFPPFICLFLIYVFPITDKSNANEWLWFFLIVCIDVGHVYSTIYRTYLDKETIAKNKFLFYGSPLFIYLFGVLLHSLNPLLFWRAMTYLAVFHFVRQQYGFMRLYARKEEYSRFSNTVDVVTIYSATIYPLLYWHLQGKQAFNWFVENDFLYLNHPEIIPIFKVCYILILLAFVAKESYRIYKFQTINLSKVLLIFGTVVSWYMGIIYLKGDLTFTLLNVVSHGIPYYALVWAYGNKRQYFKSNWLVKFFKTRNILLFIGVLIVFAYTEELLWDGFIWKEHFLIFPTSKWLPDLSDRKNIMTLLIPLLALPQLLHYFIDGFIWKMKHDKYNWSSILHAK